MQEIREIKFLPVEEMSVLKQVYIVSDFQGTGDFRIGYLLYLRKLSDTYRFVEVEEEKKDFNYHLTYPKQEYFPNDVLDELILQSVKNIYPKSYTFSHSILFTMDLELIERLKDRPHERS